MKMFSRKMAGALGPLLLIGSLVQTNVSLAAEDKPAFSGYLGDYSQFKKEKRFGDAYIYIKQGITWEILANYDKVIVDPVKIVLQDHAELQRTHADQVKKGANYFRQAIQRGLTRGDTDMRIVGSPGPETLRLRVALVGGEPDSPDIGVTDLIPVSLLIGGVDAIKDKAKGLEDIVLEISFEAEMIDASTNERLFAIVDRHEGEQKEIGKGEQLGWEAAKEAFDYWAEKLRGRFDKAREK